MNWLRRGPHLTQDDVRVLQAELRRMFPEMVIFPRRYHFHELGEEVRKPVFIDDMVEHFQPVLYPSGTFGFAGGEQIAVRVPWPEEIASGNPQRLIGRPHRRPYDDSPAAFRRFGRTVYFGTGSDMAFSTVTVEVPASMLVAGIAPAAPNIRFLAKDAGFHVEIPHDTEDMEVVTFVKAVMSIVNRLATSTCCLCDCITGKPLASLRTQPLSKSFLKRCALEPGLFMSLEMGTLNGHPCGVGPTPAQRRKWRREAGLDVDSTYDNSSMMSWSEMLDRWEESFVRYPEPILDEISRLKKEAFFAYMREREEKGLARPYVPYSP